MKRQQRSIIAIILSALTLAMGGCVGPDVEKEMTFTLDKNLKMNQDNPINPHLAVTISKKMPAMSEAGGMLVDRDRHSIGLTRIKFIHLRQGFQAALEPVKRIRCQQHIKQTIHAEFSLDKLYFQDMTGTIVTHIMVMASIKPRESLHKLAFITQLAFNPTSILNTIQTLQCIVFKNLYLRCCHK